MMVLYLTALCTLLTIAVLQQCELHDTRSTARHWQLAYLRLLRDIRREQNDPREFFRRN